MCIGRKRQFMLEYVIIFKVLLKYQVLTIDLFLQHHLKQKKIEEQNNFLCLHVSFSGLNVVIKGILFTYLSSLSINDGDIVSRRIWLYMKHCHYF